MPRHNRNLQSYFIIMALNTATLSILNLIETLNILYHSYNIVTQYNYIVQNDTQYSGLIGKLSIYHSQHKDTHSTITLRKVTAIWTYKRDSASINLSLYPQHNHT
jgi:hypothetical protein